MNSTAVPRSDQYHLTLKSSNAKTGPIPVSTTSARTCPTSCPFNNGGGCYAAGGPLKLHWDKVTRGERGTDLPEFLEHIRNLPDGQLWRHNQAGDLPGHGDAIDPRAAMDLAKANNGRRGFTYTHKPVDGPHGPRNRRTIQRMNALGFTVNVSANSVGHADTIIDTGVSAPVVAVLPVSTHGKQSDLRTPKGRRVIVCPATYRDDVTCASCGMCQRQDRDFIVGFPAHGASKNKASKVAE